MVQYPNESSGKETSDRTKKGATKSRVVPCTPNLPGNPTTHNRPLRYIFSVVASQIIRVDIHTLEVRDFLRQYPQQLEWWQNLDGYRQALQSCVLRWSPPKKIQDHTEVMKGKWTMLQAEIGQGTTPRMPDVGPGDIPTFTWSQSLSVACT